MGQPVIHFEIAGKDPETLQKYYSELFDWEIDGSNPAYRAVPRYRREDGTGVGGGISEGPEGYAGHVTVYVEVPDVDAALKKAQSLGGTITMGREEMDDVVFGHFKDPEGHLIGLLEEAK
jgi:predicted enzyme related to lactoylglutathione lyase